MPDLLWNAFAFADLCGEPLSALFNGTESCTRSMAVKFVTEAATRFRGNPAVLLWELSNENNALVDGWFANATTAWSVPAARSLLLGLMWSCLLHSVQGTVQIDAAHGMIVAVTPGRTLQEEEASTCVALP